MNVIAVASGKGGAGKSFVVANLAIILSKAGYNILAIDADIKLANLELLFGIEGCENNLQKVLKGEISVEEAIHHKYGVDILPGGLSVENIFLDIRLIDALFYKLGREKKYDYILVDCPAGLGEDTIAVITCSTNVLLVTNPEITALTDAYKTRLASERVNTRIVGTVVNMVGKGRNELPKPLIEKYLGKIIGVIPFDRGVVDSIDRGVPYVLYNPDSKITREFVKIAEHVTGERFTLKTDEDKKKKFRGFSLWF